MQRLYSTKIIGWSKPLYKSKFQNPNFKIDLECHVICPHKEDSLGIWLLDFVNYLIFGICYLCF